MIFRLAFFAMLVIAALLALFFITRKRWDWNSYAGSIAITFSALLLIPVGMFAWVSYENRLQKLDSFAEIKLNSTTADVKFLLGEPIFKLDRPGGKVHWRYQDKLNPTNLTDVIFSNDTVIEISFTGPCEYCYTINGFGASSTYEEIVKRFGEPVDMEQSDDLLQRRLNYPAYQTFFLLEQGKVIRHGIYLP